MKLIMRCKFGCETLAKIDGFEFPDSLYFHRDHMWVQVEDGKVRIGYNAWAQNAAGKVLFLRLRNIGSKLDQGKTLGTLESGKWVGPLKMPVSGTLAELNEEVQKKPSLINDDPYGRGWVAVLTPSKLEEELKELIRGSDEGALREWIAEEKKKYGIKS